MLALSSGYAGLKGKLQPCHHGALHLTRIPYMRICIWTPIKKKKKTFKPYVYRNVCWNLPLKGIEHKLSLFKSAINLM
jgi:hypothetical protein